MVCSGVAASEGRHNSRQRLWANEGGTPSFHSHGVGGRMFGLFRETNLINWIETLWLARNEL